MANPEFSESGKGLRLSVTKRRDSEGKLVCTEYSVHNTENSKSFKRIYFLVSLLALVSLLVLPSSLAQVCISAAAVGVALLFTTVVSGNYIQDMASKALPLLCACCQTYALQHLLRPLLEGLGEDIDGVHRQTVLSEIFLSSPRPCPRF
uniref:Uncharacterized protein n=1 Tax=Tetraselmis sp. GSL018 TaxID=582737 RepID=A0A061QNL0_9CHLO